MDRQMEGRRGKKLSPSAFLRKGGGQKKKHLHMHLVNWDVPGVIQKYAEKCHYFYNFNANYIIFVQNQDKFMPI